MLYKFCDGGTRDAYAAFFFGGLLTEVVSSIDNHRADNYEACRFSLAAVEKTGSPIGIRYFAVRSGRPPTAL